MNRGGYQQDCSWMGHKIIDTTLTLYIIIYWCFILGDSLTIENDLT